MRPHHGAFDLANPFGDLWRSDENLGKMHLYRTISISATKALYNLCLTRHNDGAKLKGTISGC